MPLLVLLGAVAAAACRGWWHEEVGWQVSAGGQHVEGGWHAPQQVDMCGLGQGHVGGSRNVGGGSKGQWQWHEKVGWQVSAGGQHVDSL